MGNELTRTTKKRYDQLKASNSFDIYLTTGLGKPHPLVGDSKGYYGIGISANQRLVVRPDTECLDPISLKSCDTVVIKGVEDYHGKKHEWLIP
jgi:Txe/YoeB family toxin of Txe-Axe toxin-antitoxin module